MNRICLLLGLLALISAVPARAQVQYNPDAASAAALLEDGDSVFYQIQFTDGRSKISPDNKGTLDQMAALMLAHPDWNYGLLCYVEAAPGASATRIVTQDRSRAVVAELKRRKVNCNGILVLPGRTSGGADADDPAYSNRMVVYRRVGG